MRALFGKASVDSFVVNGGSSMQTRATTINPLSFSEAFKGSLMNFTHFTYTDEPFKANPKKMKQLLHYLMYSQTALQLCPNQIFWDMLISIYFGDRHKRFNRTKLSAVLIQVKNSKCKNLVFIGKRCRDYLERNLRKLFTCSCI